MRNLHLSGLCFHAYIVASLYFLFSLFAINVNAQRTPAMGSVQTFNASTTANVRTARLDNEHVLIVYKDGTTSTTSDLYAVVGQIDTTTKSITYGTAQLIESADCRHPSVMTMSDSVVVILYEFDTGGVTDVGYSRVVSVDIDTDAITNVGAVQQFQTDDIDAAFAHNSISAKKLTANSFAIAYSNQSNLDFGTVQIGTISGSTISYGSEQIFAMADVQNIWMSVLANDKIVISYEDDMSLDHGKVVVGTISGNTVTFGSPATFNASATSWTVVQAISSSQFVVGYIVDDTNDFGYAKVGTVSGTSIILSASPYSFETSQDARDMTIDTLQGSEFVIGYNGGSGDHTRIITGEATGTNSSAAITFSTAQTVLSSEGDDSWVKRINDNTIMIGYVNDATNDHGEAVVGTLAGLALPIELVSFSATLIEKYAVQLQWITASEINNDYFIVQRSYDANHWETLTKVDGAGNSYIVNHYSALDENPLPGISYYRIMQTDFDGQISYSRIESIRWNKNDPPYIVYPNPTSDWLSVTSAKTGGGIVQLYDTNGKLLLQRAFSGSTVLDISPFPVGVYFVKIRSTNKLHQEFQILKK